MNPNNTPPTHRPGDAVDALWQKLDLDPEALQEPRSYAGLGILLVTLTLVVLGVLGYAIWVRPALLAAPLSTPGQAAAWTPAPAPAATPTAAPTPVAAALPLPDVPMTGQAAEPGAPEATVRPGETILAPAAPAVGWVSSLDGQGHFNDPNIHVGVLRGHTYYGALQFDLSAIPPNALVTSASLELTGLSGQSLGSGGVWQVRLLKEVIDPVWPALTYELLRDTEVDINILPALTAEGLSQGQVNVFRFGPEQLVVLQRHLANGVVSFRLDGPTSGPDNFFTWDGGYRGQEVMSSRPALRIVTEGHRYVVITSTPTPQNALTALAMLNPAAQQQTPTPLPPHWVTPVVVTPRPLPANGGTATQEARLATAAAMVYGTPTPTALNVWTATPTPNPVLVTATPTPENIVTAAAVAAVATHAAQTIGTYTPVPRNWITPVVVTPPPAPGNAATAEFDALMATAQVIVAGPGAAIWTATPTPISVGPTVFPTATPTPGYEPVPEALVGKIAFLSDRAGDPDKTGQEPLVYVMDPDGGNVVLLTNRAPYDMARLRDSFSADLRFRGYVEDFLRFDGQRVPGIYFHDDLYGVSQQITRFGSGIAYDPVWSPSQEQLAFIGTETGNDDIWVVNRDGSGLLQLTTDPNWDKSPSWSPDGTQVIFWSNRTGNAQVWIMNSDGSNQRILGPSPYNDWNPVWIKYPGLPPLLPAPTPTRPPVFTKYD